VLLCLVVKGLPWQRPGKLAAILAANVVGYSKLDALHR
jgi:hypothetical protein